MRLGPDYMFHADGAWERIVDPRNEQSCKTCVYFQARMPSHSTDGECRRRSPGDKGWPFTMEKLWCGEYQPAPDPNKPCGYPQYSPGAADAPKCVRQQGHAGACEYGDG